MATDESNAKGEDTVGQEEQRSYEGTGIDGRSYPQHEELIEVVPPNFRKGVQRLQRQDRCPDARIVTISEDHHKDGAGFVFLSLGVWPISKYADYNYDEAEVFIRLKENFPSGKKYGFITDPVVEIDGEYPDGKTLVNRDIAEPLLEVLDVEEVLVWSRSWKHLNVSKAEDMTKALGWTREILREPFEED